MLLSLMIVTQDARNYLGDEAGRRRAVRWCKDRGIERIYLPARSHSPGGGIYNVPEEVHQACLEAFGEAGIQVRGRIGPGHLGRPSTGWPETPCPTDPTAIRNMHGLFAFAASRFDEIIIDNRLFHDCACPECGAARGGRSWTEWRRGRLTEALAEHALGAAREANPQARLIFKFPSWHEMMASRGYDLMEHTRMFPQTCAGAETRDPDAVERWGGRQPYGAFFTVSYLRSPAPEKCPGAWIDAYACDEILYAAQAWGAILAGARELVLYCYGHLIEERTGGDRAYSPTKRLVDHLVHLRPRMDELAEIVTGHPVRAIAAYRPPTGDPRGEPYVFDYLGMLGLPVAPAIAFPADAPAAAFAQCSAGEKDFPAQLAAYVETGRPALITSRLLAELDPALARRSNVFVLQTEDVRFTDRIARMPGEGVYDDPALPRADIWFRAEEESLAERRRPFYEALGLDLDVPARVGVFPLAGGYLALQNYNTRSVEAKGNLGEFLWSAPEAHNAASPAGGQLPPGSLTLWKR